MVKKTLQEEHGFEAKEREVESVMRQDLGMRYKKIVPVSVHANSIRNLVLRQQFALEFLKQWQKNKVIINVDETWLGMTDFRRRKWRLPGTSNSVPHLQVVPRVSMIVGLDTSGRVYLSLIQANSNASVMGIFFNALIKKLESERPYWYHNTVLMLDNASYHTSKASFKVFEELRVPVLFTGPHSYSAGKCFSHIFVHHS